jgi:hypothetical protein
MGWGFGMSDFCFFWWFFFYKCDSSISARFLIYGAHAVCFFPLVTILDPSVLGFSKIFFNSRCFVGDRLSKLEGYLFVEDLKILTPIAQ